MKANLVEDLRTELTQALMRLGCNVSHSDTAGDLLRRWYDYESRRIAPAPRKVEESGQFKQSRNNLSADETAALNAIIQKLNRGDDVTGHLSKGILDADRPDHLMADWRIHHIHIKNTKKRPGDFFFERADNLAFAIINPTNAYLLEIYPHPHKDEEGAWANEDLFKIVKNSWPSLLKGREMKGKLEPNASVSAARRQALRKGGVNVPTTIGDSIVFSPGGGVTAAGTPVSSERRSNAVTNLLAELKLYFEAPEIEEGLAREFGFNADELSLKLRWNDGKIQIQEEKSGRYLKINDRNAISKLAAEVLRQKGRWERKEDGHLRFSVPEPPRPGNLKEEQS